MQLTYPLVDRDAASLSTATLRELLALVNLEYLMDRESDTVHFTLPPFLSVGV